MLLIADLYDLKFGIIPNKISLILLIYGLIFNLTLAIFFNNPLIFLFSIVLTAFITAISFVLWYIGFWGGGDFKIFIALSLALSFLDLDYAHLNLFFNSSSPFSNQYIFYPKAISILLNAILIALAFICIKILYEIIRNKKIKYISFLSLFNIKQTFSQISTKSIDIDSLEAGMVLDKYYFKSQTAYDMIKNSPDLNLKVQKEDNIYALYSLNRIGLKKEDIELIKDLYEKDLIKNHDFNIKIGIPFLPFITLGYICFLIFGDFIAIISSLIKI